MVKQCPPCSATFICNPDSGRCVSRTGPTGTRLLEEARALLSDDINVISQDRIPRWRRHMQKFDSGTGEHVYDVHSLATMIDHASRPQVIVYDDMTRQIIQPHRPKWPLTGREMTAAEVDAIMEHAGLTEWTRPAETVAVSNANRRVPRNLAAAQAGARAARTAARARQEAEERRDAQLAREVDVLLRTHNTSMTDLEYEAWLRRRLTASQLNFVLRRRSERDPPRFSRRDSPPVRRRLNFGGSASGSRRD